MRKILTISLIFMYIIHMLKYIIYMLNFLSFCADICILLITLYTAYKTFIQKKVNFVDYRPNLNRFGGHSLSITLENLSLSPISIRKINLIYDNKYKLPIYDNFAPFILEPMKAQNIGMSNFSSITPVAFEKFFFLDVYVEIITSTDIILSKFKRSKIKKNSQIEALTVSRITFNNNIITPDYQYVILYKYNNLDHTIFINDAGWLSKDIFGYNAIPEHSLNNIEEVKKEIQTIFEKFNPEQKFIIEPITYFANNKDKYEE